MCRPASFIVTRERTLWDKDGDAHEVLIAANGLDDKTDKPDFVRTEIAPLNACYSLPLAKWKFRVDQDFLPLWWNAKWAERECRKALKLWAKHHIIRRGKGTCGHGQTRIAVGRAVLLEVTGGEVWAYDSAIIQSVTGGEASAYDSATIQSVTGGVAWACGSAKILKDLRC